MNFVEPGYSVSSQTYVTCICRSMYSSMREELLASISTRHIALRTDLWTSTATEAYLTVTAHFINAEWILVCKVLLTREMPERHTGEHIAARLQDAVTKWHIPDERVSSVVCDNAANMRVAVEELRW